MDEAEMRRRVADARVARLATVGPAGRPHLVPVCFALVRTERGDVVFSGTDEKPKTTLKLQRLRNVRENAAVTLLVDHYEEEWSRVWWVRLDGRGRVVEDGTEHASALLALETKYSQYEHVAISGAVLAIDVDRWRGWAYTG